MILALGPASAPILRWSYSLSMIGAYLLLIPLAAWLGSARSTASDPPLRLYTICGLAYLGLGAVGAALLANVCHH